MALKLFPTVRWGLGFLFQLRPIPYCDFVGENIWSTLKKDFPILLSCYGFPSRFIRFFLLAQQWVFGDHTEFMVLVLQLNDVYREPILGFASQLAGTLTIETKADSQVMGQNWVQVAIGGKSHLPAPNLTWVSVES